MKTTDNYIFFFSDKDIYSNWYSARFTDPTNDMDFENTEQAYMYYKAKFFGDSRTAGKIAHCSSPAEAKTLGREVQGYNDKLWQCVKYGYMVYVNYLKFSQNPDLSQDLLSSEGKILVEASPTDRVWGCGLGQDNPEILEEINWTGQNLLGEALMEVRNLIRKD